MLLLATGLVAVAGLLLTDDGSTSDGVPELLPDLLITVALLAGGVGVLSLLNLVRVTWVLARHPWTTTEAKLQQDGRDWLTVASLGGMNDPPVLSLRQGAGETTVTLLAPVWRWRRFARSELLFAGRPGRGGVVATTDRASLVWAGRRWRRGGAPVGGRTRPRAPDLQEPGASTMSEEDLNLGGRRLWNARP